MSGYLGDNYCFFCDNGTDMSLKEHGKTCIDYQETLIQNICPFCATQIDQCFIKLHDNYRYVSFSIWKHEFLLPWNGLLMVLMEK